MAQYLLARMNVKPLDIHVHYVDSSFGLRSFVTLSEYTRVHYHTLFGSGESVARSLRRWYTATGEVFICGFSSFGWADAASGRASEYAA